MVVSLQMVPATCSEDSETTLMGSNLQKYNDTITTTSTTTTINNNNINSNNNNNKNKNNDKNNNSNSNSELALHGNYTHTGE